MNLKTLKTIRNYSSYDPSYYYTKLKRTTFSEELL
jgi:hypothetical protein